MYILFKAKLIECFRMMCSFRLILPNSIEPLDVRTEDPFDSANPLNKWQPIEKVNVLRDDVYRKLDLKEEIRDAEISCENLRKYWLYWNIYMMYVYIIVLPYTYVPENICYNAG